MKSPTATAVFREGDPVSAISAISVDIEEIGKAIDGDSFNSQLGSTHTQ